MHFPRTPRPPRGPHLGLRHRAPPKVELCGLRSVPLAMDSFTIDPVAFGRNLNYAPSTKPRKLKAEVQQWISLLNQWGKMTQILPFPPLQCTVSVWLWGVGKPCSLYMKFRGHRRYPGEVVFAVHKTKWQYVRFLNLTVFSWHMTWSIHS